MYSKSACAEPTAWVDGAALAAMVDDAELPALLPALALTTGDMSLVDPSLRPPLTRTAYGVVHPQGGMSREAQQVARQRAREALAGLRATHRGAVPEPTRNQVVRLIEFLSGEVSDDLMDSLIRFLGLPAEGTGSIGDLRGSAAQNMSIAIIGAGMSGLAAAHYLGQAGFDFVVLEESSSVGGTWSKNGYPGCRLDTPNFSYSYSFFARYPWVDHFSRRETLREYFEDFVEMAQLNERILFGARVRRLVFDDEALMWTVYYDLQGGGQRTLRVNAVVSAVGQLNRPSIPDIPGRDDFRGQSTHTATWDEQIVLEGRRVAVIGAGASAFQLVPEIAGSVKELVVCQRSAPWALPAPRYHDPLAAGLLGLLEHVPSYHQWLRFYQNWVNMEGWWPLAKCDPQWRQPGSVSAINLQVREALTAHLRSQYSDRPDLFAKVVPEYPPYAKRILRDNGAWASALKQDNVTLVANGVRRILPDGIETGDGRFYSADVIVYATGFKASEFLHPMEVVGTQGRRLHEYWNGDARALLGMTIPGFPNLFCLYGPNTNLVVNGSKVMIVEGAMHYIVECLRYLVQHGHRAMDCRDSSLAKFANEIDVANASMAWGIPSVSSWYKNAHGRVTQNWPLPIAEYLRRTSRMRTSDYMFM